STPVSMLAVLIVSSMAVGLLASSLSRCPLNSRKRPRTVEKPMWRTLKSMWEWLVSMFQIIYVLLFSAGGGRDHGGPPISRNRHFRAKHYKKSSATFPV